MPSIAKKRLLRKMYEKHLLSSIQNTKSTQTSGSVFVDRIEQDKKIKFELELIKIVDCFLHCHGIYTSNSVSFKKIFVNQTLSEFQRVFCESIGSATDIVIKPIWNPSAIKNGITKKIAPNVRQTHATYS